MSSSPIKLSIFHERYLEFIKIFGLLFLFTLISRFPYFFDTDIDWDESTFILLGQSVLNGHLPYTDVLDVKPPLLWYCFAGLIALAGKSFVLIRFWGSILVTLTAYLTYLITTKIWHKRAGLIAGILFIVMMTYVSSGQAVMSEHLAIAPLMISFALILFRPHALRWIYLAGIALGIASMIRLNLLYLCLFVPLFWAINYHDTYSLKSVFQKIFAYVGGLCSVLTLIILPYIWQQQLPQFYLGLIKSSLSYTEQGTITDVISHQIVPLIILGLTLSIAAWLNIKNIPLPSPSSTQLSPQQRAITLLILYLIGIEVSILRSGVFYDHYSIQFVPLLAVFYAPLIDQYLIPPRTWAKQLQIFLISLWAIARFSQYTYLYNIYTTQTTLIHGESWQIASLINQENPEKKLIWLTKYQLAYWLAGLHPIVPSVTHPSNINKPFLLQAWYGDFHSSLDELNKIIDKQPYLIFMSNPTDYLQDANAQSRLSDYLQKYYTLVKDHDSNITITLYKRTDNHVISSRNN